MITLYRDDNRDRDFIFCIALLLELEKRRDCQLSIYIIH